MGKASAFYEELRFDTRDPETTHVYVFIRGEGDCPHTIHGWHHKAFPSTVNTLEIQTLLWNGEDPMLWEREPPQAQPPITLFNPHEYVPVQARELVDWRASLLGADVLTPILIADAITARLAMVPNWHKACPLCRAHDMLMQIQMAPPQ
jgi:hypothetical protein